jgi:hypothetical protein
MNEYHGLAGAPLPMAADGAVPLALDVVRC